MPLSGSWLSYALAIATIAGGAVDLYRKRDELKERPTRVVVVALFILIAIFSLWSLHHDHVETEQDKETAEKDIRDLRNQIALATEAQRTAIQNQKDNTVVFLDKLGGLSKEMSDLKTKVKTEALQRELATLQTELQHTLKALTPAKALLTFTFVPFVNPSFHQDEADTVAKPVTDVILPISAEGSVHVEFSIINFTNANALNVSVILAICEQCKFAKEPEGFTKLPGDLDQHRWMQIPQLHESEAQKTMSADVIPPPQAAAFTIGILYCCDTCALDKKPAFGVVHIRKNFLKNFSH